MIKYCYVGLIARRHEGVLYVAFRVFVRSRNLIVDITVVCKDFFCLIPVFLVRKSALQALSNQSLKKIRKRFRWELHVFISTCVS